jgi:cyclophilin family peptidyl-prolyl cis-trans isomerase/HEAT repeat protein
VRRRAVLAAGRIGDRRATPLLLAAMTDSTPGVAVNAVFALGELGDTTAAVTQALRLRLRSRDSTAVEAVAALGKHGTDVAFAEISAVLAHAEDEAYTKEVRSEALLSYWRFRAAANNVSLVAPYLSSPDSALRWRATYALSRANTAAALPLLLPMTRDADPLVRSLAVRALRAAAADTAGQRAAAQVALHQALADPHPHVRINAAAALATYRDPLPSDVLMPLLQDADGNVRVAAAQALSNGRGEAVAEALAAAAADSAAPLGVRTTALTSLAAVDPNRAAGAVAPWAQSVRWLERMHAARILGAIPWSDGGARLRELAQDADWRVARAALGAIRQAADTTTEAYALYLQGLRAGHARVRAAAIAGVGRRAAPENLTVLMDAYEQAQTDSVQDAALAAVAALAELRRLGMPVANAFFERFDAPRDATLRNRIERQLGGAWDSPVRPIAPRGASFYEDVVRTRVAPTLAGKPAPRVRIVSDSGEFVITLDGAEAPLTVHNFITLIERGYFDAGDDPDARRWHRVVPNFVLQDGDPWGDGSGNPGYAIRDEINRRRYFRGALGMALSGPDSGGSQFFITHSPQPHLDGGYTIFGIVTSGMGVADRVVQEDRITRMEVVKS